MGQQLTNAERRRMNDRLLQCIISYENYASFTQSYMKYSFLDLFADEDSPVYCDYIASEKFGQQVKVSEYASYSSDSIHVNFVEISNVRKDDYTYRRGRYVVRVEFDKSIDYEDEIYTYFTTGDKSIGGSFHIVMNCEYDPAEERFFITSIEGSENEQCTFPQGKFIIVRRKSDRDDQLVIGGQAIAFNSFNDSYIKGDTYPTIPDEDIISIPAVVGSTKRYDRVEYSYKQTRARFKFGVSAAPLSAYKLTSSVPFSDVTSGAYEASADLGYAMSMGKNVKFALYGGLGVSYSQLAMKVGGIEYQYELADGNSMPYTRRYQISDVSEGLSFIDLLIPLYASLEMSFGKFALTLDAGGKLYLNLNTTVVPYEVMGTVSAIYSGSVKSTTSLPEVIDSYMCPASYMRNTYDFALFGKLGGELKLVDRRYMYFKVGYTHGLTDSYNSGMNQWYNSSEGIYPFVYSPKSGSDVAVRSFADCISYRRAAMTFDLGFRIKF